MRRIFKFRILHKWVSSKIKHSVQHLQFIQSRRGINQNEQSNSSLWWARWSICEESGSIKSHSNAAKLNYIAKKLRLLRRYDEKSR